MIRAIIVDDEPLARGLIKEYLTAFPDIQIVEECNDGFEGVKSIAKHHPDLIFLDVQMPKINGFEMLELIDEPPAVIFTTAFDEYAIRAFEAHAVDYLLKPFSEDRFFKAVEKFLREAPSQKAQTDELVKEEAELPAYGERIVVKTAGKIRILPIPQVHYLEAADDYVKVHTAEGSFLKNKTMAFFERVLPSSLFVRTHRSFIVNVQEISRIDPYEKENHLATLRSGARVPVSRSGYARLKSMLGI